MSSRLSRQVKNPDSLPELVASPDKQPRNRGPRGYVQTQNHAPCERQNHELASSHQEDHDTASTIESTAGERDLHEPDFSALYSTDWQVSSKIAGADISPG